ncbi:MAG TPA: UbiA-like polyprenyltransferase [Gemmatales bacterium]|nr:UbiA-like polyprenyltransferase [Gemmatales bacterium]HMP58286.1 UbiA-like polyprenyltransferase [Gemmatales bacterium]
MNAPAKNAAALAPPTLAGQVRSFLGMIRFSHTLFALPFALAGAVLAWRDVGFRWLDLPGLIVCMVLARSAAMAFNRLVDRRHDAANPRTAQRHLPTGQLSVRAVAVFFALSAVGFVLSTLHFWVWNDNLWPFYLSGPILLFLCGYSLAKRFTSLCHWWLGAALALAPVAAWLALTGSVAWAPVVLGAAVLFWVAGFDILYATQDADFDRAAGLFSVPARLGVPTALRVALACHVLMFALLVSLIWLGPLGPVYALGLGAIGLLLAYEHWLVRPDDLTRVNEAFFLVNVVISLGLFGLILADVLLARAG